MPMARTRSIGTPALEDVPVDRVRPHERRRRIHYAAVDDGGRDHAEDAEADTGASEDALAVQYPGKPTDNAHRKHLPRRPGTLTKEHIRHQHRHGSDQKSGFAAERNAC